MTLGAAVASGDFTKFLPYTAAQLARAFLGAVAVWIHYLPHWALTEDKDLKLGTFCTIPAVRHTGANLASEVIGTYVLVLVAAAIFSERVSATGPVAGVGPVLVSLRRNRVQPLTDDGVVADALLLAMPSSAARRRSVSNAPGRMKLIVTSSAATVRATLEEGTNGDWSQAEPGHSARRVPPHVTTLLPASVPRPGLVGYFPLSASALEV